MPNPTNPQSFNRYSYTLNNPLKYIDPTGHAAVTDDSSTCDPSSGYCSNVTPLWNSIQEDLARNEEYGCVGGTFACSDEDGNYIANPYDDEQAEIAIKQLKGASTFIGAWYVAPTAISWIIENFSVKTAAEATEVTLCSDGNCFDEVEDAYEIAVSGGRHAGFLRNYANRSISEIQKAISSLEVRVQEHLTKVANPAEYIDDWENLDPRAQEGMINFWNKEIQNYAQQSEILRKLLGE